ncbi:hypothetical protein BST61_g6303 [Cercospora zeina]
MGKAIALGFHRAQSQDVDQERWRIMSVLYVLDSSISLVLGQPPHIADGDVSPEIFEPEQDWAGDEIRVLREQLQHARLLTILQKSHGRPAMYLTTAYRSWCDTTTLKKKQITNAAAAAAGEEEENLDPLFLQLQNRLHAVIFQHGNKQTHGQRTGDYLETTLNVSREWLRSLERSQDNADDDDVPPQIDKQQAIEHVETATTDPTRTATEGELLLLERFPLICNKSPEELAKLNKAVLRKLDWKFLPCITGMLLMNYLDRINVSNARLAGMQHDVGNMSDVEWSAGISMFYGRIHYFPSPRERHHREGEAPGIASACHARMVVRDDLYGGDEIRVVVYALSVLGRVDGRAVLAGGFVDDFVVVYEAGIAVADGDLACGEY